MIRSTIAVAALLGAVCAWPADPLVGRNVKLEAGPQTSLNVPVALLCDVAAPKDTSVLMRENKTGKSFPATIRDGVLVFVPEGAMPNTTHVYTVQQDTTKPTPHVQVTKKAGKDEVDVVIDDVPFTTYHYSNDNKKPFLWPVFGEGGVHVTRDWPLGDKDKSSDHPHHKSMWSAYGNVNGSDCWGEEANSGFQISGDVTYGSGDAYGWIHAKNTWADKDKKPILTEEREYRFYTGPESMRLFDLHITFTPVDGDVLFKDTKEGGIMALRVRDSITEPNGGKITNADGKTGEKDCWGKPSKWCDYSGPIQGAGVRGAAIFDNPGNLRYPSCWHVRGYGLMGASVFGLSDFTNKAQNGDYTIKKGETITFNYRVAVHSGDPASAKLADRYADYIAPPKVSWVKN